MKFKKAEKRFLGALGVIAYLSGALVYIFGRWVRVASSLGPQHHPWEPWVRECHTTITYSVIGAVGYLAKSHILPGLRSKQKERLSSGIFSLVIFIVLLATAVGTLYSSESMLSNFITQTHAYVGLFSPTILLAHAFKRNRKEISVRPAPRLAAGLEHGL